MTSFNAMLFSCLPTLLGKSLPEIVENLSFSRATLARAIGNEDWLVNHMIELCNHFRIDISAFFIESGTVFMPTSILVEPRRWRPVVLNESLLSDYGFSSATIRVSQLAAIMSINEELRSNILTGGGHARSYIAPPPVHEVRRPRSNGMRVAEEPQPLAPPSRPGSEQYEYNWNLMRMLPHLLAISGTFLSRSIGRSPNLHNYAVEMGDIRVPFLVDICNRWHIPISHFIRPVIPANLITPEDQWQPIIFYRERIRQVFMPGEEKKLTVDQLAEIAGVDRRSIMNIFKPDTLVWMSVLIRICNFTDLTPMYFFSSDDIAADIRLTHKMNGRINMLEREIDENKRREAQKESRIRHLENLLDI